MHRRYDICIVRLLALQIRLVQKLAQLPISRFAFFAKHAPVHKSPRVIKRQTRIHSKTIRFDRTRRDNMIFSKRLSAYRNVSALLTRIFYEPQTFIMERAFRIRRAQ